MFNSKSYLVTTDAALDDSDKSFTATGNWLINGVSVKYISTASVGNRVVTLILKNAAGTEVARWIAGGTQAASLTYYYNFTPCGALNTTVANLQFQIPIPWNMCIPNGYILQVIDTAAIAAAADDMTVTLFYSVV
jgi:hypothetical protein